MSCHLNGPTAELHWEAGVASSDGDDGGSSDID